MQGQYTGSLEEYKGLMHRYKYGRSQPPSQPSDEQLRAEFDTLDSIGTGVVSPAQLDAWM